MTPRTFRAARFDLALAEVRKVLGPDAVVLSSRETGGALGRSVEVEAAPEGYSEARNTSGPETHAERVLKERLIRRGIPERAAETLVRRLRVEEGRVPLSLGPVRDSLETVLGDELVFAGPIKGAPRAVALIGPTGVGKTTTIAKIAANAALVRRRRVGLVSIDSYRVGGTEQLQRYADLMGVPMRTAKDERELREAMLGFADRELVLIDTAGRSPSDRGALEAMSADLSRAGEPVEVHLCVRASCPDIELRAIIERHACAAPRRLLITKLDEAVYHGGIVAAQTLAGLPFSYFTTGQRVPEDLEIASAGRLASLLCGEEVGA